MASLVSLEELQEGMVLAEPVINNFGQTLLPSGIKLNSKHKVILKTWNIDSVYVQSEEGDTDFDISTELKQKAAKKLLERMNWLPEQKIEKDMFSAGIILKARTIITQNDDQKES